MGRRFGEEQDIARCHHRLHDEAHIVLYGFYSRRRGLARLETPRHDGKTAGSLVNVTQLPGDGDAPTGDHPVLLVVPVGRAEGLAGAVQVMALGAGTRADEQRAVVEAKPTAAHFVESGDDDGVDEQFTEGLTMGCRPAESMPPNSRRPLAQDRAADPRASPPSSTERVLICSSK